MNFVLTKFLQSWIKKIISLLVAIAVGPKLQPLLLGFGITVDPTQLSIGLFAALEGLRVWLSHQSWSNKLPGWVLAVL